MISSNTPELSKYTVHFLWFSSHSLPAHFNLARLMDRKPFSFLAESVFLWLLCCKLLPKGMNKHQTWHHKGERKAAGSRASGSNEQADGFDCVQPASQLHPHKKILHAPSSSSYSSKTRHFASQACCLLLLKVHDSVYSKSCRKKLVPESRRS